MSIWSLENLCIRHFVLKYDIDIIEKYLPECLAAKVRSLRTEMDLFMRVHRKWLDSRNGIQLIINSDGEFDWIAVMNLCINRYLLDETDNDGITKAFSLAAVTGFEERCEVIWHQVNAFTRRCILEDVNIEKVVKYTAWRICRYGLPYQSLHYDDACREAAKNGWKYALRLWITRIPELEVNSVCKQLILHAILHRNYHLLEILPLQDVSDSFHLFFPDGRITNILKALADAPKKWKNFTDQTGRALLEWVPQLDIIRARRDFGNNEETACYVSYIDLLLECSTKRELLS